MYRVLYVDDEPALLELGKEFLEQSGGIHIDTALLAADAIKKLEHDVYDGIIADYQMPEMDGIVFLKYIRAHYGQLPFILFTGRGREEVVIEALNSGADFYLQKGGDPRSQFVELEHKIRLAIERRQTADELRESRQRMTDIIDHLPDATFAIDVQGAVIAWNRAMEVMTGVKKEQILGTGDYSYALPFYGTRRPLLLDLVLKDDPDTEQKYPYISRMDNKLVSEIYLPLMFGGKGAYFWFTASPLYDTHGKIAGAIESIRDISHRKEAEEALKKSEERYRAVVEDQTEFITRFLPDGTHVFVNEAYCRNFGKTPAEIIGTRFVPHMFEEDIPLVRQHLRELTRENPSAMLEHRIILPDGQVRWQQWSDRAIFDEQGNLVEYQSVGRDITDRKNAEERLKAAFERITSAEEELREQYDEVKNREEALRESEENYRALFDGAADLIAIVDLQGTFLNMNSMFEEESGYKREEMVGRNVLTSEIVTAPSVAKITFHLGQIILKKRPRLFEIEGIAKDGTVIPYEIRATPILKDGRITMVQAILRNISERRIAEEKVRESRTMLEEIVNGSPIPQFVMGKDHKVISWNRALEEYTGVRAADVVGTTGAWKAFYEKERPVLTDLLVDNALDKIPEWYPEKYSRSKYIDGAFEVTDFFPRMGKAGVWMYFTASAIRDADGVIIGAVETLEDITEIKAKEEALRESEEKFRLLTEKTNDIVYSLDLAGRITHVSPQISRYGYMAEDIIGKDLAMFVEQEDLQNVLEDFEITATTGQPTRTVFRVRDKSGIIHWLEDNGAAIVDRAGNIFGISGILRDVTDRRRAEDELRSAYEQITAAEEELRQQYEELQKSGEALRASEAEYRAIFDNTGTATVLIEENTTISLVNSEFERLSGYSREEIEGKKSWTEFVVKEDLDRMLAQHRLRREKREAALRHYEFRFITKSGDIRNIFLTIDMIPGTKRSVASLMDITGRTQPA